jgi:hypothetical protein
VLHLSHRAEIGFSMLNFFFTAQPCLLLLCEGRAWGLPERVPFQNLPRVVTANRTNKIFWSHIHGVSERLVGSNVVMIFNESRLHRSERDRSSCHPNGNGPCRNDYPHRIHARCRDLPAVRNNAACLTALARSESLCTDQLPALPVPVFATVAR